MWFEMGYSHTDRKKHVVEIHPTTHRSYYTQDRERSKYLRDYQSHYIAVFPPPTGFAHLHTSIGTGFFKSMTRSFFQFGRRYVYIYPPTLRVIGWPICCPLAFGNIVGNWPFQTNTTTRIKIIHEMTIAACHCHHRKKCQVTIQTNTK